MSELLDRILDGEFGTAQNPAPGSFIETVVSDIEGEKMTIEKIEGYLPYRGVVGDLLDKVNELVDAVNALTEHTHGYTESGVHGDGRIYDRNTTKPLDNR